MHHTQHDWELEKLRMKKTSSSSQCRIISYSVFYFSKYSPPRKWWPFSLQSSAANERLHFKQDTTAVSSCCSSLKRTKDVSLPRPDVLLAQGAQIYSGLRWRPRFVFQGAAGCQGWQLVAGSSWLDGWWWPAPRKLKVLAPCAGSSMWGWE